MKFNLQTSLSWLYGEVQKWIPPWRCFGEKVAWGLHFAFDIAVGLTVRKRHTFTTFFKLIKSQGASLNSVIKNGKVLWKKLANKQSYTKTDWARGTEKQPRSQNIVQGLKFSVATNNFHHFWTWPGYNSSIY